MDQQEEEVDGIEYVVTFQLYKPTTYYVKHLVPMHILAKNPEAATDEVQKYYAQMGEDFKILSVEALPEMTDAMKQEVAAGNVEPVTTEIPPKTKLN